MESNRSNLKSGYKIDTIYRTFIRGIYFMHDYAPFRRLYIALVIAGICLNYFVIEVWYKNLYAYKTATETIIAFIVPLGTVAVLTLVIFIYGHPFSTWKYKSHMRRSGFTNAIGEAPTLIRIPTEPIRNSTYAYEFKSNGITFDKWQDEKGKVEQALDIIITDISRGKTMDTIIAEGVSYDLNDSFSFVKWSDKYFSREDFVLALGRSITDVYSVNLAKTAHALIAGSTGSGKTIMLKCLIYQSLKKGADVLLVDFKGGANFSKKWKSKVQMATNEDELSEILDFAISTLNERKKLFAEDDFADIIEFNNNNYAPDKLNRIVIVFDEVAECFDKTGLSSNDKKKVAELEHKVATIARLGRAFGIHLILGLQRPDANVLTGQIKSNIDLRLCGRCDDTLSMIVLDSTNASREISSGDIGRFMTYDGTLIQGFFFSDDDI